jgi:hypothetical protein
MLTFSDVSVYEARSDYWSGQILRKISGGESLYLKDRPWGFEISCDWAGGPRAVHFGNGVVWSFCRLRKDELEIEWPLFLEDYRAWVAAGKGKIVARVTNIFSDSFHLDLMSNRVCMHGLLVWHYPPATENGR